MVRGEISQMAVHLRSGRPSEVTHRNLAVRAAHRFRHGFGQHHDPHGRVRRPIPLARRCRACGPQVTVRVFSGGLPRQLKDLISNRNRKID